MTALAGGTPVRCQACATTVLVRKNSLTQTSIQWLSDSSSCPELAGKPAGRVPRCNGLRDSIDDAVARGDLRVEA